METEADQAIEEIHRAGDGGSLLESRTQGLRQPMRPRPRLRGPSPVRRLGPEAITRRIEDGLAALADHGVRVARDADCQASRSLAFSATPSWTRGGG